eukprot:PhF_6_TR11034/c0_g1_i1/m.17890
MRPNPSLQAHWNTWGGHISHRLQSKLLPKHSFDVVLRARSQAQELAQQMAPDANIYLEGSIVTTGLLEKGSDLDLCCVVAKQGSVPDAKTASKQSEKLYRRIKYSIPSFCKIQQIDMVRIPLVKYVAMNTPEIVNSIEQEMSPERAINARTASFHFAFNLAKEKEKVLLDLMKKQNCTVEESKVESSGTSSTFTFRAKNTNELLRCIGVLPDGASGIISRNTRDQYTRNLPNQNDLPELLRFSFDITFLGYAVRNSYLIRKYLHDPNGPSVSRLCQMAIKKWGKVTEFGVGTKQNLTSYGMTIMWIYFLLRTGQVGWFDPWLIPDAMHLPSYPEYAPLPAVIDNEQLAAQLYEFFKFYQSFDFANEVISLSRPAITTRQDVGWVERKKEKFHFNMCIEDPYEDDLNCARRIDPKKLEWFKELCAQAMFVMQGNPGTNLDKLLGKA